MDLTFKIYAAGGGREPSFKGAAKQDAVLALVDDRLPRDLRRCGGRGLTRGLLRTDEGGTGGHQPAAVRTRVEGAARRQRSGGESDVPGAAVAASAE